MNGRRGNATRGEVLTFLRVFKGCVMLGRLQIRSRAKNRRAMLELGMTTDERRDVLLSLQPEDYVAGPMPDHTDSTKDVWEFGKTYGDAEIYIKVRVSEDPRDTAQHHALVWSFHEAEYKMSFPLKGGG